jgi:hypothetical protein
MSDPEELLMLLSMSLATAKGVQGMLGVDYEYGNLDSREIDASSEVDEAVKHLKKAVALLGEEEGHDQGDRI